MFWVGLGARLIPPDEFQADSSQNQSQQGPAAQICAPRRVIENNGRHGVHGLDLWRRGLRQKCGGVAAKNYAPDLKSEGTPQSTRFLIVLNSAS